MSRRCPPCPPRAYITTRGVSGFKPFSAEDLFPEASTYKPPPKPASLVALENLRPGSLVKVGGKVWRVFRSRGFAENYVVQHGTAGRKMYLLRPESRDNYDTVVVRERRYDDAKGQEDYTKIAASGPFEVVGFVPGS